ncbi:hypothetical protein [Streptomyces sp. NPDC018693]|uniref:hypothetical protein n=1 Tax=unclassified Streptomyces TaxID=2593676 RepID=UPI003793C46D
MSVDLLTTSYYTGERLAEIRGTVLDVYADVYADDIATNPFFSMERFEERLESHAAAGGWSCVIASVGHDVAGFTYGFTARDDSATFKLCENMLRERWRRRGISRLMHDEGEACRTPCPPRASPAAGPVRELGVRTRG